MPNDARWDAVLAEAGAAQERYHVPGAAIGVLMDGETRTGGLGVTDPRAPLTVDGDTLFQIGSISKTVTAALVLMLQQRGLLELDTPLRAYLPDFRVADEEASENATPRLLFSHTAGWLGDYFADDVPTLQHAVERMRWLPQNSTPWARSGRTTMPPTTWPAAWSRSSQGGPSPRRRGRCSSRHWA